MTVRDIVLDACLPHASDSFYVQGNIKEKAIKNVLERFNLTEEHEILAIVDTTVFRSGKLGAVLTDEGIHVLNPWLTEMKDGFIDWDLFQYADLEYTNKMATKEVWIDNVQFAMAGSSVTPNIFHDVLQVIQTNLRMHNNLVELEHINDPPPLPYTQWMVTIKGTQYGPYEEQTVLQMIQTNQLNPQEDYVWKEGMTTWKIIEQCEAFQPRVAPMPPPPPVPAAAPIASAEPEATDEPYERIDVNEAELGQLLSLPYIDLQKANDIILHRNNEGGKVQSVEELRDVLNLEPHAFEEVTAYLFVTVSSASKKKPVARGRVIDY